MTQKEFKNYISLTIRIARKYPNQSEEDLVTSVWTAYEDQRGTTAYKWFMWGVFVGSLLIYLNDVI